MFVNIAKYEELKIHLVGEEKKVELKDVIQEEIAKASDVLSYILD